MSEDDRPQRGKTKSDADQTLLGVAPPRIDSSADSPQRSPVFVRSGTSVADAEPAPLPRMALPSRPPRAANGTSEPPPATTAASGASSASSKVKAALSYARVHPVVGMVLVPVFFSLSLLAVTRHGATRARLVSIANSAAAADPATPPVKAAIVASKAATLAELESRLPSTLRSYEVILLAEGHAEQKRAAAGALRLKVEQGPPVDKDGAVPAQLLHLAEDPATAVDALSAMAHLGSPTGADLLYEVWTGTSVRTDTTELARALLYSTDVRPTASPALAVALELRVAEACEQYQALLPKALTDGDRRAAHLLTKLTAKRGCGAKKTDDCYACLRATSDELSATINAVKSRRAPSFASQ